MTQRRLVGIDLGIASSHTVRVLAEDGSTVAKRRCWPTKESLEDIERSALAGAAPGTRLEVVLEPTGPAWLPIAVFFGARGHTVYRVSSAKAADLRRFLSRHAKSNGIDAETLARLPLVDPTGLQPLRLPGAERAALDRRVRATDRLTRQGAEHKTRIKSLVRQLLPMSPLGGELTRADLALLERYADPNALLKAGKARLTRLIATASKGHLGAERAEEWLWAAQASLDVYEGHPAVAFSDLAAEVATEIRLLAATERELAAHANEREYCYRFVDGLELARSIPGLAEVGGPALVACMGDPSRFSGPKAFRRFTGLTPRASETGDTDRKGQPMSKAGSALLRTTLIRAADTARRQDPQLARIYHVQMVERGKEHLGALCVVAAHLAERAFLTMDRAMPYVICDVDGTAVTPEEARKIIAEQFTVTEEVRRRRRSRKAKGKASQKVLAGHSRSATSRGDGRGDPPRGPILNERFQRRQGAGMTGSHGRPAATAQTGGRAASGDVGVTAGCGVCGKALAAGQRQWCSNAHRQAAYRRRHAAPAAVTLPPARSRRQGTVYECPDCGVRHVGEQYCSDCHTFARRLGPGGPCPCCGEAVTAEELVSGLS